ncbi:MAG TPA: hypothetical protein VMV46_06630 [Thermoanaerobaculia bacterium]|nr:hypothetical protein [Thermoanaerobaculia bacterium]
MENSTRSVLIRGGRLQLQRAICRLLTPVVLTPALLAALLAPTLACSREPASGDVAEIASAAVAPTAADAAASAAASPAGGPDPIVAAPPADAAPEGDDAARGPDQDLARREAELREREAEIARREELAAREAELAERERRLAQRERTLSARQPAAEEDRAPAPAAPQVAAGGTGAPDEDADRRTAEQAILVESEPAPRVAAPAPAEEPWNEPWRTRGRDREPSGERAEEDRAATERRAALERLRAGTSFEVEIEENLSSGTSEVGDTFRTRLVEDVRDADGVLVVPAGSVLWGEVTDSRPLRRVGGQATLALEFRRLELPSGESVELRARFVELGRNKKKDKAKIAGAAIAGAILGRILGDGEAAAVGAAVGAAAGTAAVMRAEGREVEIPAGTPISLELEEVVTVTTRYGEPLR